MTNLAETSFREFLVDRIAASDAFVDGEIGPLDTISTRTSPASIFPPNGLTVTGADEVNAFNARGAAAFGPGGENAFEVIHSSADGDLAYLVGVQHSRVRIQGQPDPVPMHLRLTEVFRRETDGWKLIHRHADPAAREDGD